MASRRSAGLFVLEQVAARSGPQRVDHQVVGVVGGEDHDPGRLAAGAIPLVAGSRRGRHADVHQHHVGRGTAAPAIASAPGRLAHPLQVGLVDRRAEAGPDDEPGRRRPPRDRECDPSDLSPGRLGVLDQERQEGRRPGFTQHDNCPASSFRDAAARSFMRAGRARLRSCRGQPGRRSRYHRAVDHHPVPAPPAPGPWPARRHVIDHVVERLPARCGARSGRRRAAVPPLRR